MTHTHLKDPDERLDYTEDWDDGDNWLNGDTISSVSWTVPSGLTNYNTSNTTTSATIWLTGGTHGQEYLVSCKVTTAGGRIGERSLKIVVRNR